MRGCEHILSNVSRLFVFVSFVCFVAVHERHKRHERKRETQRALFVFGCGSLPLRVFRGPSTRVFVSVMLQEPE